MLWGCNGSWWKMQRLAGSGQNDWDGVMIIIRGSRQQEILIGERCTFNLKQEILNCATSPALRKFLKGGNLKL